MGGKTSTVLQHNSSSPDWSPSYLYVQSSAGEILILFTFREWVDHVTLYSILSPLLSSYSNLHWLGISSYSDFDKNRLKLIYIRVFKGWLSSRWFKEQNINTIMVNTSYVEKTFPVISAK